MTDINELRNKLAAGYEEACKKISHPPNKGIVRQLQTPVVKSFYLDVVYRGNDKLNFGHRMTDKDLILLSDLLREHQNVIRASRVDGQECGSVLQRNQRRGGRDARQDPQGLPPIGKRQPPGEQPWHSGSRGTLRKPQGHAEPQIREPVQQQDSN